MRTVARRPTRSFVRRRRTNASSRSVSGSSHWASSTAIRTGAAAAADTTVLSTPGGERGGVQVTLSRLEREGSCECVGLWTGQSAEGLRFGAKQITETTENQSCIGQHRPGTEDSKALGFGEARCLQPETCLPDSGRPLEDERAGAAPKRAKQILGQPELVPPSNDFCGRRGSILRLRDAALAAEEQRTARSIASARLRPVRVVRAPLLAERARRSRRSCSARGAPRASDEQVRRRPRRRAAPRRASGPRRPHSARRARAQSAPAGAARSPGRGGAARRARLSASAKRLTPTITRSPDSICSLAEGRVLDLALDEALLDRGDRAAELVDPLDQLARARLDLVRERLDEVGAAERVGGVGRAGLVRRGSAASAARSAPRARWGARAPRRSRSCAGTARRRRRRRAPGPRRGRRCSRAAARSASSRRSGRGSGARAPSGSWRRSARA